MIKKFNKIKEESDITLKKATLNDLDEFLRLEKTSDSKTYSAMLDKNEALHEIKNNVVYFIQQSGKVIGGVMYERRSGEHAHISGLIVDPHFQGAGVGRKAMELILREIGGTQRIDLVTHPENTRALKLYESLGFIVESRKENYYGDGQPRLVLVREKR